MLHLLLALIYLSSAQLWPLDFADDDTAIAVGDDVWLAPGKHTVPISGDYSAAYIEFTFKSVYASHSCEYQVWADGDKVYSGSFRNAVATTIPSMLNTFPPGTSEITVWTNGCWLNRHALPFTLGANGNVLYIYDIRPSTVAAGDIPLGTASANFGITFPKDSDSFGDLQSFLYSTTNGMSGTSSFSSQVSNFDAEEGWFFNGEVDTTYVLVDWTNLDPFNAAGAEFVMEIGQFSKVYSGENYYYTCNNTLACDTADNFLTNSILLYSSENTAGDSEHSRMYYAESNDRQPEAATLKIWNEFQLIDSTWNSEFAQTLAQGSFGGNLVIYIPYVKMWNLNASVSDSNHAIVDLRSLSNPAASAGDCVYRNGINPNNTFFSEVLYNTEGGPGDFVSGGVYPWYGWSVDAYQLGGFLTCPNDDSGLLSIPIAPPCLGLSDVATNNGEVVTTAVPVTVDMPNGAVMRVPIYDAGLKNLPAGSCGNLGWPSFYLSQVSWFDVEYDGTAAGEVGQAFITNNFAGRATAWGTYQSFFIDSASNSPADLVFRSKPGFSMDLHPFVFIHGLAPTSGNGTVCDPTACENGGVCARASSSTLCINPDSQGGEPVQQTEFAKILTEGTWIGTWFGPTNSEPVPFCTPDTCWNGGECVENPARTWDPELFGTGQADNPTWCNCSGVTRETALNLTDGSSTGSYWGELCQYAPPCDATPCFNNGTCTNEGGSVFSCDCSGTSAPYSNKPYEGNRCEVDPTTPCDLNPCLNGACTDTPGTTGGFTCVCTGGWSGHSCGIPPVDNCLLAAAIDVCGEFGRCVASFNPTGVAAAAPYTQCVCLYGYSGATCNTAPAACNADYTQAWQKRDVEQRQFNAEYCLNGGSCIGVGDSAGTSATVACLCEEPWVGSRCQWNSTIFAGASSFGASLMTVLVLAVVALF